MTPDELARYRAFAEPGTNEWVLLDVVEAAWADRARVHDIMRERAEALRGLLIAAEGEEAEQRSRAERAEQIVAGLQFSAALATEERNQAEAALARVRDLDGCTRFCHGPYHHPMCWTTKIRAAIEGDNQ